MTFGYGDRNRFVLHDVTSPSLARVCLDVLDINEGNAVVRISMCTGLLSTHPGLRSGAQTDTSNDLSASPRRALSLAIFFDPKRHHRSLEPQRQTHLTRFFSYP